MDLTPTLLERIGDRISIGLPAVLGQLATLIYNRLNGEKFNLLRWVATIIFSLIIGEMIAGILPDSWNHKTWLILVTGTVSFQIYTLIEAAAMRIIKRLIER